MFKVSQQGMLLFIVLRVLFRRWVVKIQEYLKYYTRQDIIVMINVCVHTFPLKMKVKIYPNP